METKTIDSIRYAKFHKDFESVSKELLIFNNKLNTIGFIESNMLPIIREDSLLIVPFNLNKKFNSVTIHYNDSIIPRKVIDLVSNKTSNTYFTIPIEDTEKALSTINLKLAELGDPFSTLQLSEITINENSEIEGTLISSEKLRDRRIDKIIIKGYEKFPKSYLKYYLKIKEGNVFNLTKIKKQIQNLNELPFASQIKDPEILFTKDSTTLYIFLDKVKSNNFDGFIGFGSNEETNKIEFSGYLNLELNNNLNYGESFRLVYKSDENEQKTFQVNLNLPYLFGSPIGTELELHLLKKDSSFSTASQNAKIFYQLNPKNKVFAGIRSVQSNNLLDSLYSNPTIKDYSTLFFTASYQYKSRQKENILFNVNRLFDIQLETGNRTYENTSTKQYQVLLDAFNIFNLNLKNSIYIRVNGFGLFSDNYFDNELGWFGGINSIRGFEENSLAATLFGVLNTEYRYVFNNSIYVHTIIDFAYLENKLIDQKEKLYSFGFGFGLITKAGLLKFNFANGKSENQSFKFSNSQVHLSLTAFF
ncbi:POTRA domain-containing protein [Bizionia arctica]|uniref:Membrane protein n=1 Tax=Bizionia arctica TaxID=1495645 RepID=A0A917GEU0_9FLAO|nr:POTRA domain-containing protein [Bizionia arctica]GGG42055.1 membrane protein [Bizionia arctica]